MKALTIKQPWASLIMWGGKDIENRSWSAGNFRGRIAIHSSLARGQCEFLSAAHLMKTFIPKFSSDRFINEAKNKPEIYPCGCILGTIELIGCTRESDSPWFVGEYGFALRDPRPLAVPIQIKGKLGFWDLPEEIGFELMKARTA